MEAAECSVGYTPQRQGPEIRFERILWSWMHCHRKRWATIVVVAVIASSRLIDWSV